MYSKTYGTTRRPGREERNRPPSPPRERGMGGADRPRRGEGRDARDNTARMGERSPYAQGDGGNRHVYERGRAYLRDDPSRRVVVPPNYTGHAVTRDNAVADHDAYPLPDVIPWRDDAHPSSPQEAPQEEPATDRSPRDRRRDRMDIPPMPPAEEGGRALPPVSPPVDQPTYPLYPSYGENDDLTEAPPLLRGDTVPDQPEGEEHTPPEAASMPASALSAPATQAGLTLFGKGIGWEELLILGLIFFLLRESEGQSDPCDLAETILLLGALLVMG